MFQYVTMDGVAARPTLVPWRCHAGMLAGKPSCAGSKRFGDSAGLPRHRDSQALTVEFVDDTQHPERPAIAGAVSDEVRLWLNDGSYIRLRPERPHHVRSISANTPTAVSARLKLRR
jgi:hypothetical protein